MLIERFCAFILCLCPRSSKKIHKKCDVHVIFLAQCFLNTTQHDTNIGPSARPLCMILPGLKNKNILSIYEKQRDLLTVALACLMK